MRKHARNTHVHALGAPDRLLMQPDERPTRWAALKAVSQGGEVIYAARLADGMIKIGHTSRLANRLSAVGGEPIAFMYGTLADEQTIHDQLADHVHHGREWYYPTPGVMAVVNEMRAMLGLEPIAA